MSRPIVIPGTGRSITRVTTRVRNLERRYIPTGITTLDWVWVVNMNQLVGGGDGTSEGSYSKYCQQGTIHSLSGPFTLVTESTTYGGTAGTIAAYDLTAIRCLAGVYLATGGWTAYVDSGAPTVPLTGAWFWKLVSKDPVAGWNTEAEIIQSTDTWRLTGSLGTGAYPTDPNVIPEMLQGTVPITVKDLGDGFGYVNALIVNIDTTQHLYTGSFLFLQRQTLGLTTDQYHSNAAAAPAAPSATPGSQPQSLPGVQGPATVG